MARRHWTGLFILFCLGVSAHQAHAMTPAESNLYLRNLQDREFLCTGQENIAQLVESDVHYDTTVFFRLSAADGNRIELVETSTVVLAGQPYTVVMQATGTAETNAGQPSLVLTQSSVTTGTPLPPPLEWHTDLGTLTFTQTGDAPRLQGTLYDQTSGEAIHWDCHLQTPRAFPDPGFHTPVTDAETGHRFILTTALKLITCEGSTYLKGDQGAIVGNVMTNIAYQLEDDGRFHGTNSTVLYFDDGPLIQKRTWYGHDDLNNGRPRLTFDQPGDVTGDTFAFGIVETPYTIELTFDDTSADPNISAIIDDHTTRYPATCHIKPQ